jgi:hypothetical protein
MGMADEMLQRQEALQSEATAGRAWQRRERGALLLTGIRCSPGRAAAPGEAPRACFMIVTGKGRNCALYRSRSWRPAGRRAPE